MKAMPQNEMFGSAPFSRRSADLIRQDFRARFARQHNFGLGEPDLPTPKFMREERRASLWKNKTANIARRILPLREKSPGISALKLQPAPVCVRSAAGSEGGGGRDLRVSGEDGRRRRGCDSDPAFRRM